MDVLRHELGFSKVEKRFPAQGHLPRDLFASRQHAAAARRDARRALPMVRRMGTAAHAAVSRVRGEEAGESGARLRRPAAVLARDDERRAARGRDRRRVRSHPRRRVSGHERAAGRDSARTCGRTATASRSSATMRRRFIRFARRPSTTSSAFRTSTCRQNGLAASVITLEDNYRSTQGVLDAANALMARRDAAVSQGAADDEGRRSSAALRDGRRRSGAGRIRRRARSRRRAKAACRSSGRRCCSEARITATRSSWS